VSGEIKLWDVAARKVARGLRTAPSPGDDSGHAGGVVCLAVAPDGQTLATGGWDRTVKFWDLPAQGPVPTDVRPRVTLPPLSAAVSRLAYAPDGKTLAVATGASLVTPEPGELVLWDVAARKARVAVPMRPAGAGALAFAPDGRSLAVAVNRW